MDIIGDLEREWRHLRHHQTSAAPAAATATIEATPGGPVSFIADLKHFAAELETIGEDGAAKLQRVAAHPETAELLDVLDKLTGLNITPGLISLVGTGLGELAARATPPEPQEPGQAQASFTPAGPQVGGQAH